LVLLYLLLASGDLFLQKLVHVMPTMRDKKSAVAISHEIQQNISNYLFSVTLVSLIFWTWLWGVPGALLSVPILVSIKVVCDRVPAMSHVSELIAR
jgi:predicted PurR-regulated permease PerM